MQIVPRHAGSALGVPVTVKTPPPHCRAGCPSKPAALLGAVRDSAWVPQVTRGKNLVGSKGVIQAQKSAVTDGAESRQWPSLAGPAGPRETVGGRWEVKAGPRSQTGIRCSRSGFKPGLTVCEHMGAIWGRLLILGDSEQPRPRRRVRDRLEPR